MHSATVLAHRIQQQVKAGSSRKLRPRHMDLPKSIKSRSRTQGDVCADSLGLTAAELEPMQLALVELEHVP